MNGYAVFDVETTGLSPAHHHRVVEIGIVLLDPTGVVQQEWTSLINPERDIGASEIHRLSAADVALAPRFGEIAPEVVQLLDQRVVIAHNLPFDARFLASEFVRVGLKVPRSVWDKGICTMRWSGAHFPPGTPRTLHACCAAAGIGFADAHSALPDAQATALLFTHLLGTARTRPEIPTDVPRWPEVDASSSRPPLTRREAPRADEHFLSRIVDRLPGHVDDGLLESYLAVLDRALLDRHLSVLESQELVETANYLGLSRAAVIEGHNRYLGELVRAAWEDGVITQGERQDLEQVAGLLGLSHTDLDEMVLRVREDPRGAMASSLNAPSRLVLSPGDHIVFTGVSNRSRDEWHSLAEESGLVPRSGVTKKTRAVVAADPDTQSSKAKRARTYGIPVITESAFESLLDRNR